MGATDAGMKLLASDVSYVMEKECKSILIE